MELTESWEGEKIFLLPAAKALQLIHDGAFTKLSAHEARRRFDARAADVAAVREFARRVRLDSSGVPALGNDDLRRSIRLRIEGGQLVAARFRGENTSRQSSTLWQSLRRLVKEVERYAGPEFRMNGRHYAVVPGAETGGRNRDEYEVTSRDDGDRVLGEFAQQAGLPAPLLPLLAEAREKLSRDWRPPLEPDGIVVLRRKIFARAVRPSDAPPASTPSQLIPREEKTWIEVELVDEDDQPYVGTVEFKLADGRTVSSTTNAKGLLRLDGVATGKCKVTMPDLDAASWSQA